VVKPNKYYNRAKWHQKRIKIPVIEPVSLEDIEVDLVIEDKFRYG
jgi:hypothetical protein